MAIKIKNRIPKSTDFTKTDVVINTKEGALYFKSELGVHRLVSQLPTPHTPDYGPHPDVSKKYFLQQFGADWKDSTTEEFIDWTNQWIEDLTNTNMVFPQSITSTRMILMPFAGTIHKLFYKQTGTNPTTTIRLYHNINDQHSNIAQATNNTPVKEIIHQNTIGTGNNSLYGNINEVEFNQSVNAGDHIMVTMQASADGTYQTFGHLLYSQTINI